MCRHITYIYIHTHVYINTYTHANVDRDIEDELRACRVHLACRLSQILHGPEARLALGFGSLGLVPASQGPATYTAGICTDQASAEMLNQTKYKPYAGLVELIARLCKFS